eukprot:249281-Chlamydomonas_euryale.AAC.1
MCEGVGIWLCTLDVWVASEGRACPQKVTLRHTGRARPHKTPRHHTGCSRPHKTSTTHVAARTDLSVGDGLRQGGSRQMGA